ncbi:MAG: thiamine pyrophosphate-binding protein [Pseudomonadota bacterium]
MQISAELKPVATANDPKTGGQILVDCLAAQGVTTAFGVPGESYLAVLDALHDSDIRFVLCRQEGGAAFAAEAWGKLTGQPGICFVTRGPGATNASIGVHTAMQNSSPMILLVGQVGREMRDREAFQEIDYRAMFGTVAKWVTEVDSADRMAEIVARAFVVAQSDRPGPVVISLPEDMLVETALSHPAPQLRIARPGAYSGTPSEAAVMLDNATAPLILIGGGGWQGGRGLNALSEWAETASIPIAAAFRCQDLIDNHSPAYIGDAGVGMPPHVRKLIEDADVILALNIRFGEMVTDGYTLFQAPMPRQDLIHVHPSAAEIGKIYQAKLPVHSDPEEFLQIMTVQPTYGGPSRKLRMEEAKADYEASFDLPEQPGTLDMGAVMAHLHETLPPDAVLTNGAGNFAIWPGRLFKYGPENRLLGPQSGAMGAGIPAALAAKIADPGRMVVCFAGDGDVQMTMQELGTAMQAEAPFIVLVLNNGSYGTIRMHQEREYPGRVSGTELQNPDFVKIGEAYGMHAERVEHTGDFADAFLRAMMSQTGALLELMIDPEAITPRRTLSQIRGG